MDLGKLLDDLTIEEKIGQLWQIAPFFFINGLEKEVSGNITDLGLNQKKVFLAGSVLGIKNASEMIAVQKKYLEKSRHKIPLIFMADIIHGYETIFPVPLAIACSWNPSLAYQMARISAIEASTAGLHVTFSPMADVSRDPRWGRVVEGFGEDSYLTSIFAAEMVKGYQNINLKNNDSLISCIKHFAGYGASESGRDYNTVDVSRLALYGTYLPPYKKAIDAGAKMVMTAFNVVDGVPATVNQFLLKSILREQWKFNGVTITDYDSLHQVVDHGCAVNDQEAAYLGMNATLDIEMASTCYQDYLKKLIESNQIEMIQLDEAVMRILKLKNDIGLFENPYKGTNLIKEKEMVRHEKHLQTSKNAAHESAVLLTNDGILPLSKKTKIALLGPYVQSKNTNGPWSWHGNNHLNHSLEEALLLSDAQVLFVKKATNDKDVSLEDLNQLKLADVVILALGEHERQSGEAHSRSEINLPDAQSSLVRLTKENNLKSIVLLNNGRPLVIDDILDANAIFETWYLGSQANEAIVDLLFGIKNPSGKLTMSFPMNVGQIPIYYNHLRTGRPKIDGNHNEYVSYYLDVPNHPRFPFGFGLSYAKFVYRNLQLNKNKITPQEKITASIEIENDSQYSGNEVIQLYLRDYVSLISKPVLELRDFKKLWFEANESKVINFEISMDMLTYLDANGDTQFEYGKFAVMIGTNSNDVLSIDFDLVKEQL